jgi:hypothetical protein
MAQQTAVEFFIKELRQLALKESHHLGMGDIRITQGMLDDFEEKYKQMEKEQIAKAYDTFVLDDNSNFMTAEQYYNETYQTQAQ